ncbi:unnamed protein product [Aspergillus oryzae]|nr:unnamed protein product [Aspergillus oryzae]
MSCFWIQTILAGLNEVSQAFVDIVYLWNIKRCFRTIGYQSHQRYIRLFFFQQRYDIPSSKPKTSTHPKQSKATLSTSPYIQPRYNLSINSLIMKFTAISLLLAASTALASPVNVRSESLKLTGLTAKSSKLGDSNIQFSLTDPNYPEDTPTDCAVKW